MLQGKKAVIFDLDGTIVDSIDIWNKVDRALIATLGGPELSQAALSEFREQALARHSCDENPYIALCGEWGRLCGSSLPATELHAMRYRISRQMLQTDVCPREGIERILAALKQQGLALAIATTTKRNNIEIYATKNTSISSKIRFDDFAFILSREDVQHIKPDPEIYLLALKRLGLHANQCLVVEDSLSGALAARAAGIDVAVIDEPFSRKDREALLAHTQHFFVDYEAMYTEISRFVT